MAINRMLARVGLRLVRAAYYAGLQDQVSRLRDEVSRLRADRDAGRFSDVYGSVLYFNPSDEGMHYSGLEGPPVRGEAGYMARHVRPGQTVVDVGANVGMFTMLLSRLVGPAGRVFAFEPGPQSYLLLCKNISANGCKNVVAERAAVLNRSGETDLLVCPTGESDNRIAEVAEREGHERVRVKAIALDDYLDGRPVDFMKVDVQGAEPLVFRGMARTFAANPGLQVITEFVPDPASGFPPEAYLRWLRSFGFSIHRLDDDFEEAQAVSDESLLASVGPGRPRLHTNLVLRRP
jgi:FkbM family methyltransferase